MGLAATGGTLRSSFADLLEPGFRKIFFDQFSQLPTMYDKIFNVATSSKQQEYDSSVSGFGTLTSTSEGAPITYEDPLQGYDTSYVHTKYAKGFKVTREMYEDDQYNIMKKMPKALASSTNRTVETQAAAILNNSFTSGTGGDAKYLCATDHPRADGGTAQSNKTTYGISESYLNTAYVAMVKTLDDKGQKILVRPDTLVIPPDLEATTRVLLESQGRTATNYNEINPYQGKFKVIVWNYLSSTQAWFMLDSQINQLNFFWRVRPEFAQDESFDTDVALYKVRCRFSVGWSDWRGVYGSTGTQ